MITHQTVPLLTVIVRRKEGIVFRGNARSVSSTNEIGAFDNLPKHCNFVSVIEKKLAIVTEAGKTVELEVHRGILHVEEDKVEVYLWD